jgi:hypothetical protein
MGALDNPAPQGRRSLLAVTFVVVLSAALFVLAVGLLMIVFGDFLAFEVELATGRAPGTGPYRDLERWGSRVCLLAAPLGLIAAVAFLAWLYRAWRAVPARHRDVPPGLAVGLLLVPVWNLYWMFRAIPGLSSALRRALGERDLVRRDRTNYRIGVVTCIMALTPGLVVVSPVALMVWVWRADREVTRVIEQGEAGCPAGR